MILLPKKPVFKKPAAAIPVKLLSCRTFSPPSPLFVQFRAFPPYIFFSSFHTHKKAAPSDAAAEIRFVPNLPCSSTGPCQTGKQASRCNQTAVRQNAAVRQNVAIKTEHRRQLRQFRQQAYCPIPKPPKSRKYRPHRPEHRRRRGRQA